jgi:MFS family permease
VSDDRPAARPADQADVTTERERPVTFRVLFSNSEFRAIYIGLLLNSLGDYLARAAITVLVYQQTSSVLLSAASFAISYLPWLVGGPLLAALAERYPYRRVMVISDVLRGAMIALVAIPAMPIPVILLVLFVGTLASPPSQAARSALLPLVMPRDQMVAALTVNTTTGQAVQVIGYFAGATIATVVDPRLAITAVAVTFALSALIIAAGVRSRPPASSGAPRNNLLRETGEGFQIVFGHPILRAVALVVFCLTLFAVVPEGLAAAWAAESTTDAAARGLDQGMIMAAAPIGWVIGGLAVSRLADRATRQRLIRPFAVLAPIALVPSLLAPAPVFVALLAMLSGIAQGGLMPQLQGLFALILPHGYRARAFGVMQGSLQLLQGSVVLITGVLADLWDVPVVVGLCAVCGVVLMVMLTSRWPSPQTFDQAITDAAAGGTWDSGPRPRHSAPAHRADSMTRADSAQADSMAQARPTTLAEADELRQTRPAQPTWRPQPAEQAESRLLEPTPLESLPLLSRPESVPAGAGMPPPAENR